MIKKQESYRELNLKFYDALNQIFNLKKHKTWNELSQVITLEKISLTYKVFSEIFPYNLNRYEILPKNNPNEKLTSIFHGILDGKTIINNIARHSLYCDEIIVFHPLQNPQNTNPEIDPISKPQIWKLDFINSLYFYIVLQKWVVLGLVHIIENPFNFDQDGREKLCLEAEKRINQNKKFYDDPEITKELEAISNEKLRESILGMPINEIRLTLKKAMPNYTDDQINQMAIEIKNREKKLPLYVDLGETKDGSLIVNRSGGNIEMIDAICHLTGAYSYTTQNFIKKQLELRGTNPFWTKFGSLYSGLNLKYLNNVDTNFALKIREEERISGLRKSFRDLSSFLEQNELDKITDDKILHFNDKIKSEISRSEEEWKKIITDAQKINTTTIFTASTIGAFVDPTKIIIPAIGIPSGIVINEFFKMKGLKSYRNKDPYSVFVDLKNKKPNFFSDLKNCIL